MAGGGLKWRLTVLALAILSETGKSKQTNERDDPGGGVSATSTQLLLTPEVTTTTGESNSLSTSATAADAATAGSIKFVYPMKNFTKLSGGTLKLRCEVEGEPAVTDITWFRNEMLLTREAGRVKIRNKVGSGDTQWSRVRIKPLETMDTGFYRCQATNGKQTVSAESMVKVRGAFTRFF